MALSNLSYSIDNLDKAKQIIQDNMHLLPKDFPDKYRIIPDHHWAEKITLANKIINHLNYTNGPDEP